MFRRELCDAGSKASIFCLRILPILLRNWHGYRSISVGLFIQFIFISIFKICLNFRHWQSPSAKIRICWQNEESPSASNEESLLFLNFILIFRLLETAIYHQVKIALPLGIPDKVYLIVTRFTCRKMTQSR